jgi:hypothetical protein
METFINTKMVGVGPILPSRKNDNVPLVVRTNWDILADLARVKRGDYIILHSKGLLKGVFEAESDPMIKKEDVSLFDGTGISVKNWNEKLGEVNQTTSTYKWWIFIKPTESLYFKNSIKAEKVFDLIATRDIKSLPPRLRYEDKNKTVKGLLYQDFIQILKIFVNYSERVFPTMPSQSFHNLVPITFDYLAGDQYEKNLEAIIVNRIRTQSKILNVTTSIDYVLNTVPLGYLKMADLLTWSIECLDDASFIKNPWIWEIKKEKIELGVFKDELKKLVARSKWLKEWFNDNFKVTMAFVAKEYEQDILQYVSNITLPLEVAEEAIIIEYSGVGTNVQFSVIKRVT